jgi:hypothetical protein
MVVGAVRFKVIGLSRLSSFFFFLHSLIDRRFTTTYGKFVGQDGHPRDSRASSHNLQLGMSV